MQRRVRLVILVLVVSLLVIAVPTAFAQSGGGDKVVFDQAYTLEAGTILNGNLAVVGGSVTLEPGSTVGGDVVLFGGQLVVDGAITGNVAAFGGHVTLGESAVLAGDFTALGGSIDRAPGATIQGETLLGLRSLDFGRLGIRIPGMDVRPPLEGSMQLVKRFFLWQLRTFGTALLLALLGVAALLLVPRNIGRIANAAAAQSAVSLGMGLLTLLLALFAGALLLIACGLGLLVWLGLASALLLGWIGVGLWVGQRLLAALKVRTASASPEVIIGIFVITVLAELPSCIGFFIWLLIGSIGLGAVVLTRFGSQSMETGAPVLGTAGRPAEVNASGRREAASELTDGTLPDASPGGPDPS